MAVKLIHKNSGVKNKPVLPSQIEYGEISINWHDSGPFIQVKDASNEIVRVGGVIIQDNQPALAQKGAFWLSGTELYLYNGTAWILISGGGGGTGGDFIACSDGGLVFDTTDQCWQIDEAWLLEWAQNNAPGSVDPGDGELTIVDADGNTLGVFTANQSGDVEIVLPPNSSFSGDYDDLTNKPAAPGDGELLLKDANDDTLGTFTANQSGNVEIVLPAGFSGDYDDLTNKPAAPGDGKLTVKDSDDSVLGEFTANQTGDTEIILPASGGGGGLDDILNAPVVKDSVYALWEYYSGDYVSMTLEDGTGSSESTWKSADPSSGDMYGNSGQASLDGYIEYKTTADNTRVRASNCMVVINDLVATAYSPDMAEDWTASGRIQTFAYQGFFHSNAGQETDSDYGDPQSVTYKLKLEFTNIYGEPETLWVDATNYNYVAMRREDIDLREMEALDAEIKASKEDS